MSDVVTTPDAPTPEAGPDATPVKPKRMANPVLRRELIERWRGPRAFWILTGYLAVLTATMLLLMWAGSAWATDQAENLGFDTGPAIGRFLFDNALALVLLYGLFVGPGYAAAQIAQERERRTLGLLQITMVTPWRIVMGKLGASVAWLLLLVLTAAPLASAAFFLGGVTVGDLVRGVTFLLITIVCVAAIGIGVSSLVRRTVAAVVVTYGIVLFLVVGTLFLAFVEGAVRGFDIDRPASIVANPFVGLADAAGTPTDSGLASILTPFAHATRDIGAINDDQFGFEREFATSEPAFPIEPGFGFDGGPAPFDGDIVEGQVFDDLTGAGAAGNDVSYLWVWIAGSYLLLAIGMLTIATYRVRPGVGDAGGG